MQSRARPSVFRIALCAAALLWLGTPRAQTPQLLPRPSLALKVAGEVNAIARQSDGSIVFGGDFSSVNAVPRRNLARILADGRLDMAWNPDPNDVIEHLAVSPADDAVFISGSFDSVGGIRVWGLAKVSGTGNGAAIEQWQPPLDASFPVIHALAADADALFVAGNFRLGGVSRALAKFSQSDGQPFDTWDGAMQPDGAILAMAVDRGSIYLGGMFSTVGGVARSRLARLSAADGALDHSWNPSPNGTLWGLSVDAATGALYVAGNFDTLGAMGRISLGKIEADGSIAAWNPAPDQPVEVLTVAQDGSVYAAGNFTVIAGVPRAGLAKLSGTDGSALDWHHSLQASGRARALIADTATGNLHLGGNFGRVDSEVRLALASIGATGGLRPRNDVESRGSVDFVAARPNGGLVVAGNFATADGTPRRGLLRTHADGTLDGHWAPQADGAVYALAVDDFDDTYVAGDFATIDGVATPFVAKLSAADGSVDASWQPPAPDAAVRKLALDANTRLYAGGNFTRVGAQSRIGLARFHADTGELDAWKVDVAAPVFALALDGDDVFVSDALGLRQHDATDASSPSEWSMPVAMNGGEVWTLAADGAGSLYAGGDFGTLGGSAIAGIAKISSGPGTVDTSWNPSNQLDIFSVLSLAFGHEGHLYAGGYFLEPGGALRSASIKLPGKGSGQPLPWKASADGAITSMALASDARIAMGGLFTTVNGEEREGLAALTAKAPQAALRLDASPATLHVDGRATLTTSGGSGDGALAYGVTAGTASCALSMQEVVALAPGACTIRVTKHGDRDFFPAHAAAQIEVLAAPPAAVFRNGFE